MAGNLYVNTDSSGDEDEDTVESSSGTIAKKPATAPATSSNGFYAADHAAIPAPPPKLPEMRALHCGHSGTDGAGGREKVLCDREPRRKVQASTSRLPAIYCRQIPSSG